MSEPARHARLVEDLVGGLEPVRPLPAPTVRTLVWLGSVLVVALALTPMTDADGMHARLGTLDLRLAALGALLTAITAAFAAFATSVPGRSLRWALLPIPSAALWIGSSGVGCLRGWIAPGLGEATGHDMQGCFVFLVGVSLPLSVLLVLMLRRACPLRPNMSAALAGLAAAAAAAVLLIPFHPHDATATDLLIHAVAVLGVVGCNALAGGRLLDGPMRAPGR